MAFIRWPHSLRWVYMLHRCRILILNKFNCFTTSLICIVSLSAFSRLCVFIARNDKISKSPPKRQMSVRCVCFVYDILYYAHHLDSQNESDEIHICKSMIWTLEINQFLNISMPINCIDYMSL